MIDNQKNIAYFVIIHVKKVMQKSNLILYFRRFSKRDWREFRKFVRSPYFNQREDIVRLFDYLDFVLHHSKPKALDRKKVFTSVFPTETFEEKKLRHITSFLLKITKRYLAQAESQNDPVQMQQYLCKSLHKKGLGTFFEKELFNAQQILEKETFRDSKYYFQKYQLGLEEAMFTMPQRRSGEMNLQSTANQLTISYISSMLRLSCNIQSHQTMSKQVYDLKLLPEVLALIESGFFLDVPSIAVYFRCYSAFEWLEKNQIEASENNFEELKHLIAKHWKLFPPSEIRDIYLFAINYCIKRLNAGDRNFIREAFELFRSGLINKTLLEEGILSSFTYKNITRLGMALKEDEWVEQFLEMYKKYLLPRERENTWRYNLAFFYFQQQKYKQAMRLLLQTEFKDVLNNLDARRMLLKSYFELGEFNALDSLLDSFLRYIHRQKILVGYHKENYLNLIRFVKKIIQIGMLPSNELNKLKEEILRTPHLAEREWLLEKINAPGTN